MSSYGFVARRKSFIRSKIPDELATVAGFAGFLGNSVDKSVGGSFYILIYIYG